MLQDEQLALRKHVKKKEKETFHEHFELFCPIGGIHPQCLREVLQASASLQLTSISVLVMMSFTARHET